MKRKLVASLLLLSVVTVSPDLLWRLKILLAQLNGILAARQNQTMAIQPAPSLSRTHLDSASAVLDSASAPDILSLLPARGGVGTAITIRGRGFTKTGNDVYASYGTFLNLPSADGETITLTVSPPGLRADLGAIKTATFPILRYRFYVRNANGETKIPGEFVLDL